MLDKNDMETIRKILDEATHEALNNIFIPAIERMNIKIDSDNNSGTKDMKKIEPAK